MGGFLHVDAVECKRRLFNGDAMRIALHARWLTQQNRKRDIDRRIVEVGIRDAQVCGSGGFTNNCVGAALTGADRFEAGNAIGVDREHVAFLTFVAPKLERAHAGFGIGYFAQLEVRTTAAVVNQFG